MVRGRPMRDPQEQELADLLTQVTASRFPSKQKRSVQRAWLRLSSGYDPQVVQSILQRLRDREFALEAKG